MSTKTERQRKKLFRKRIWPKICSALGIIFINLIMIFVIFMCLLFYGVGLQIATNEKQTPEIKARYENLLLESTDAGDAFSKLMTEQRDRDMILFNRERKSVASRGKISINREIMMENDIFSRYPIYMDRVTQNHFESTDFLRGLFKMITKTAFAPTSQKKNIYSGDFEEDYHFDYWVEIPVKDGYLCVKNSLLVLDFSVNMAGFVISAVIFLQLLVLIIFCGSILSDVVIQHRLTKLYYLETLTGGKNWLYFVNYGNRLLRRKKGNCYAVVDFELVKFRNFCSVYGTGKGDELLEKTDAFLRKGLKKKEICARYSLSDFALVFSCRDEQEAMGKVYAMMGGLIGFMEKKRMICHAGLYLTKSREGMKKSEIDIAQMFSKAGSAKSSAEQNPESTAIVFNEDMLKQQTWEQHVMP